MSIRVALVLTYHHFVAIGVAEPGSKHDKKLRDAVRTTEQLPAGCEEDADKGYQGLGQQVQVVTIQDMATRQVPCLTAETPIKKPTGQALTADQQAFNHALNAICLRVGHGIG